MVICSKLSDAELLNAIYKAASEYSKSQEDKYIIRYHEIIPEM